MRTWFAIYLLLLSPWCAANPSQHDWRVQGEVRAVARSADGRYGLSAQARKVGEVRSADQRYALKAVNVGCDPLPDPLFANGFETP